MDPEAVVEQAGDGAAPGSEATDEGGTSSTLGAIGGPDTEDEANRSSDGPESGSDESG